MKLEFKIEQDFRFDLAEHLTSNGINLRFGEELKVFDPLELGLLAVNIASTTVFFIQVYIWLQQKRKEGKNPKFEIPVAEKNITTFEELESNLKQSGII